MLNKLIYTCTLNTVAASDSCEKAIMNLVSPGGLIDLIKNIVVRGSARSIAEFLKPFFEKLFDLAAKVVHPVFAVMLDVLGSDSFSQKLLEFVQRAKVAAQCLNQHDDVWKEAAERAGVDVDTLKHVVRQLSGKSEEEIRRRVEELAKSLEDVKGEIRANSISPDATYFYAKDWLAGREEGGKLKLCNVLTGDCEREDTYVEYVPNPLEEAVVNEVRKKAAEGGGLIVVRGAKGIGKSTAVQVALYRILQVPLKVGDQYYKPVVVAVRDYNKDEAEKFIRTAKKELGVLPILYLDPSKPRAYPKKPTGLYQPEMSIEEVRPVLDKLRDVTGAVAVVVLSNDQYLAVEGLVSGAKVIDADQLLAPRKEEKANFVKALVEKYSGCRGETVMRVADAIASSFKDGYAVAAVLAADLLKEGGCRGGEVERVVKEAEGNVHRFALHYLWYGLFNGDETVAKQYAPLLSAVGFFGPHPPKLAEAVVRAFGGGPEGVRVQWFSQPLHGTIFDAIKNFVKCVHKSRDGGSDIALCKDNVSQQLIKSIPRELAENEERVVEVLKKKVIEASANLSPLVEDFTKAVDGRKLESLGRWVLKSQALGMADVLVEDVYDRLDVLLAVLGIAGLRTIPSPLKEFAKEWILVGGEPAQALSEYVLAALHADRGALRDKIAELFYRVRSRGYLTQMDLWEIVGLLRAVDWGSASDEEVKYALRLSHYLFREYEFVLSAAVSASLQRLFKAALIRLDRVAGELAFLYRRYSIEGLDPWALYDKVNRVEKVFILQGLLRQRAIDRNDLGEAAKRVEELEKELKNGDIALLLYLTVYPRLAAHYAVVGEREKAEVYIDESLKALSHVGPSIEKLWRLLSPYYSPFEFVRWAAELPLYVSFNAALAYMALGNVQRGLEMVDQSLAALPAVDLGRVVGRDRALERELDLLKRLHPHILDLTRLFVEEGGRLFVNSPFGPVEYVEVGVEGSVREALSRGRVAVVYGPRGVGKSTTALKAIYDFAKAQLGRMVVVVRVGEDWEKALWAAVQLRGGPFVPVLYYDTVEVEAYRRSEEGVDVMYSHMAHVESLAYFLREAAKLGVPTVVVLAEEDYRAYEDAFRRVGAGAVRMGGEAEALVVGILKDLKEEERRVIAEAVLERYKGEFYAVAAALAKALYEEWRDPAKVADAVKRLAVHFQALAYFWHAVLGRDKAVARWAAPLILATGFYGPHPPRLGEAVAVAMSRVVEGIFGAGSVKRDDDALKWLTQPLHGILYEAIEKVAHSAVYRRFGVGNDELCQGSVEGPCRLVEICSDVFTEIPPREYSDVVEVAEEYAKLVAKALNTPGPSMRCPIDALIRDFLSAHNGAAEDGRWMIRYEVKGPEGVKTVEDVVDELDVLSALFGVAVLPGWYSQLKPLEEWFFVDDRKVGVIAQYLYPILREMGGELVKRAAAIVEGARRRGFYTYVDLWRAVGIAAAGRWDSAADEDLENSAELAAATLNAFATYSPIVLHNVNPLLSEAWHRVAGGETHEGGEGRQRLADKLTLLAHNAAKGDPRSLPRLFAIGADRPDLETVARRFDALYNAASNAGKLRLLEAFLYALGWDVGGVDVAAVLLGKPWLTRWEALEETHKRIDGFVSRLNGVEKAYAVARLYSRLAVNYASFGKFGKAMKLVEEEILKALEELEELQSAYEENKESTEERLRPHLELRWVKPDLGIELNNLSQHVYRNVAFVYMAVDELDKAVEYAERACDLAKKLGDVYNEVASCSLPPRLKAVRGGVPPAEEFEEVWQRALQDVGELGAEAIAATLGQYVVALASVGRLGDIKKVLEEWGWALEPHPGASALTYGVLSLFDGRHLEKAVGYLPEWARANLPRLANALHDAVKSGIFSEESKIAVSAMETLTVVYGRDVVKALLELASESNNLFLSALVGLAYCKRGEEWGLKLAREAAQAGSQLFKDRISGPLFGDLYKALEGVKADDCITKEVLKAVYKLYYYHV